MYESHTNFYIILCDKFRTRTDIWKYVGNWIKKMVPFCRQDDDIYKQLCINTHIYIYTYIHTNKSTYVCIWTINIYICINIHICICLFITMYCIHLMATTIWTHHCDACMTIIKYIYIYKLILLLKVFNLKYNQIFFCSLLFYMLIQTFHCIALFVKFWLCVNV